MSNGLPDYLSQEDEPIQPGMQPVDVGRSANDRSLSNYLSSPGESSLLDTLGGGAQAPAGGGMGALMLPLMLAQMQQQQQRAASPLGAFATGYRAATGQPTQQVGMDPLKTMQFVSSLVNQQDIMRSREDARLISKGKFILAEQANQRAEQTQRRADERADSQTLKPIIDDMIAKGNQASKKYGWQHRSADLAKATGQGIPDDIIEDLSKDTLPLDKMKDVIGYVREGVPDETVAAVFKLPPEQMQWIKTMANSPEHARVLELRDKDEAWKEQERAIKIKQAVNADVKLDLQQAHERRMEDLMVSTQARQGRAEERADRRLAQTDQRLDNWQKAFDQKMDTKDEKKKATLNVMKDTVDQMEQVALRMNGKNFLPQGPGWFATQKANLSRAMSPSDTDITAFQKILQGSGVGFERSVMNDIGPRALAAYKGILSFYDTPPTLGAIQSAAARMRRLIEISETGQMPGREKIVYQTMDPATKQKKTFQADWEPGFNLPPGAKLLMVGDERME